MSESKKENTTSLGATPSAEESEIKKDPDPSPTKEWCPCIDSHPEEGGQCTACGRIWEPINHFIGHVLDKEWRILEKIGQGGMGLVYLAKHIKNERQAAIKVMKTGLQENQKKVERFLVEAELLQKLKHPNIVQIFSFGYEQDSGFYIAMEYLDGTDLDAFVQPQDLLPIDFLCKVFLEVCEAIHYAHEQNIIHRDLKPGNIFLVGGYPDCKEVKLLDFGVAKALDSHVKLTEDGFVMGTPNYLSPEQALGQPLDRRTDIYTLSAIFFELLTGCDLFEYNNYNELMTKKLVFPPPLLTEKNPNRTYPTGLQKLLEDGLAGEKDHRITDAMEFKRRLQEILDGVKQEAPLEKQRITSPIHAIQQPKDTIQQREYPHLSADQNDLAFAETSAMPIEELKALPQKQPGAPPPKNTATPKNVRSKEIRESKALQFVDKDDLDLSPAHHGAETEPTRTVIETSETQIAFPIAVVVAGLIALACIIYFWLW